MFWGLNSFSSSLHAQAQGGGGISPHNGSAEGGGEVEMQKQEEAQGGGGFNATNRNQSAEAGGGLNPQDNANNAQEGGGGLNTSTRSIEEGTNASPSGGLNLGKQNTASTGGGLNVTLSEEATEKSLPWGLIIGAVLLIIIGLTAFKLNRKKNNS